MKTRKREGGYSREKPVEFDTPEVLADHLRAHYAQNPPMPRWRHLEAAARSLATSYLQSQGLPVTGYMFKHRDSNSWTSKEPNWWRRTDPEGMAASAGWHFVPFDQYIQQERPRDILANLAVHLIFVAKAMREVAAAGKTDALAHWSFELGKNVAQFQVYSVAAAGGRRKSPPRPWAVYAARLIERFPGQTKDAIWHHIPVEDQSDGENVAGWEVTRNDADSALIAYTADGRRATLKRGQFFKRYLCTRRTPKN